MTKLISLTLSSICLLFIEVYLSSPGFASGMAGLRGGESEGGQRFLLYEWNNNMTVLMTSTDAEVEKIQSWSTQCSIIRQWTTKQLNKIFSLKHHNILGFAFFCIWLQGKRSRTVILNLGSIHGNQRAINTKYCIRILCVCEFLYIFLREDW